MVDAVVEGIPKDELTVERVRTEVRALTEKIAAKQLELQLMVGSRYHELIDSADSVVSMYRSCKRLQHVLGEFKGHLQAVNETRPAAHLLPPADARFLKAGPGPHALVRSNVLFMVHAPTVIWEHIDRKELLQATRAYLRAKAVASTVTSVEATTEDMKKAQAMVLRQWSYVGDLSEAIKRAARNLLANQAVREREAHASALGALCLTEGLGAKGALDVYLDMRSQWLTDDLNIQGLDGDVETVQLKLTRSVQAISRTLLDTYSIFVSSTLSDSLGLGDVALQSVGRPVVAEAATAWVARHIDETYKRSQSMLKLVRTAQELAGVRQALWAEANVADADAGVWREACMSLIVMDKLRSSLSRPLSMSLPYSNTSTSLDLWGVLFSRAFAALAEDLLSESLAKVKTALVQRVESVLVTIRGDHLGRLTAVEMAWTAQHMGSILTNQVTSIGKQADSLVQEGDRHASGALAVSMRTQTLRLLAHVVAYLRVLATSLAQDEQVDGLLIVVRLASYLGQHMGVELDESSLPPPAGQPSSSSSALSSSARPPRAEATIDFVQLESAFTIADTRGEGTLTKEELKDALDTIGLGGSDVGLESCTLPEFALLCSPILDERRPSRFLKEALETVFRNGLAAWAAVAVRQPAISLHASIGVLEGSKAMTDAVWRSRHAGWQEKLLLQEDEGGSTLEDRVWLPSHVSPWFSTFLFLLSTELSRVTQSRDGLDSGLGAEVCLMEAFRTSLVSAASAEVHKALASIQAPKLCEAAVLQCTLDHLFLQQWLEGGPLPGWDALQARLDPINYQMYEPTLLDAVRAQGSASSLLLSFLLHRLGAPGSTRYLRSLSSSATTSRHKTRAASLDDVAPPTSDGSSSNTMPLVTCVPRFTLLPVVVEASTPASSRLHSPPRDAHRQPAGGAAGGSAFNFFNATEGAGGIAGVGKGVVAGGVANAATVLSSFSSLSALGNQAASTATSFLSRATAKRST